MPKKNITQHAAERILERFFELDKTKKNIKKAILFIDYTLSNIFTKQYYRINGELFIEEYGIAFRIKNSKVVTVVKNNNKKRLHRMNKFVLNEGKNKKTILLKEKLKQQKHKKGFNNAI